MQQLCEQLYLQLSLSLLSPQSSSSGPVPILLSMSTSGVTGPVPAGSVLPRFWDSGTNEEFKESRLVPQ